MRRQPWAITMLRSKDQMIEEEAASIEVRSLIVEAMSSVVHEQNESNHFHLITQLIQLFNRHWYTSSWHYATIVL